MSRHAMLRKESKRVNGTCITFALSTDTTFYDVAYIIYVYIKDGSHSFEKKERVIVGGREPATCIILPSSKFWYKQDM